MERVLIACRPCGRQYDASHLAPGDRLRCECGERLTVERHAPRSPRPRRCGACGGALAVDARTCAYCDAEITLEERGLREICPVCYARLLIGARFCMDCGVAIEPQAIVAAPEAKPCPRCAGGLRSRSVGRLAFIECKSCAGLWLEPGVLETLCDDAEASALARQALGADARIVPASQPGTGPMYLACIRCDDRMTRRNFGGSSGIVIDVCKHHGLWLDHAELERILDFVRSGGLVRARERERARAKSQLERAQDGALPSLGADDHDLFGDRSGGVELTDVLRWAVRWLQR